MAEPEQISTILARVIEDAANLENETEGWRRRNLIFDSQLEELRQVVNHLRGIALVFEDVLERMPDAPWLEVKLTHLLDAILKSDRDMKGALENGNAKEDLGAVFGEARNTGKTDPSV